MAKMPLLTILRPKFFALLQRVAWCKLSALAVPLSQERRLGRMLGALSLSLMVNITPSFAASYDQMVLVLGQKPYYRSHYDAASAVLTLNLRKVSSKELAPLQLYDTDLVSRVWVERLSPETTKVKLYLRSPQVRYAIRAHNHPFRLAIELFTEGALEARDPATGLPLLKVARQTGSQQNAPRHASSGQPAEAGRATPQPSTDQPYRLSAKNPPRAASSTSLAPAHLAQQGARKRRLLQPVPKLADDPSQRMAELAQIKAGRLAGWQQFPHFVYRINTNSYKNSENYQRLTSTKVHPSPLAGFAHHAAKLYEFGHEYRSLAAYRYVLQNAPQLFNEDPLHLWRMAELNLGSNNFALAKGYYQALASQFPADEIARFAKLRLADILWLPEASGPKPAAVAKALAKYQEIAGERNGELASEAVIRRAYLGSAKQNPLVAGLKAIPTISAQEAETLTKHRAQLEHPKTVFYSRILTLRHTLRTRPAAIRDVIPAVQQLVKSSRNSEDTKSVAESIRRLLIANINSEVTKAYEAKDFLRVVDIAKSSPQSWQALSQANHLAVAESYRQLGQYPNALEHYKAYRQSVKGVASFVAGLNQLNCQLRSIELLAVGAKSKRLQWQRKARKLDRSLWQEYLKLKPKERRQVIAQQEPQLIRLSQNRQFVATPARIVLSVWQHSLLPDAASLESPDRLPKWQPDGRTVPRLTNLKKTFHWQGMKSRKQKVEKLLAALDPKLFKGDPVAKKIWAKEILSLAEKYRKSREYLKAGRMYTLSARHDDGWERRAEALYKGGLLLYRAGRRQEAETAFRQASLDVNNLLYAELAKKRLEQISKP